MFKIGDRVIHKETQTRIGTIYGIGRINQVTGQMRWLIQFDDSHYDDEGDCHVVYEKNLTLLIDSNDILKNML